MLTRIFGRLRRRVSTMEDPSLHIGTSGTGRWTGGDDVRVLRDEDGAIVEYDEYDVGCCALPEGHDGECAYLCERCDGSGRCSACGGHDPGDDLGSGCTECDGWGRCTYCDDGLVEL